MEQTSALRYVVPSDVLYHEIGHHIHKVDRPEHEEREDVAEKWKRKLRVQFFRKHFWYVFPLIYVLAMLFSPFVKRRKNKGART